MNKTRTISNMACEWVVANKRMIIEKFAGKVPCLPKSVETIAYFMSGSPGAGKTEFSKNLIKSMVKIYPMFKDQIVRIDADEIRKLLPLAIYTGKNAKEVQKAASKGVDKLFDHVIDKNKDFVLDGTFVNLDKGRTNIKRSIKANRIIEIWYIYQEPELAWNFTKKREAVEGRKITKAAFINAFLSAKKNVNIIKKEFGSRVSLNIATKNRDNVGIENYTMDVEKIDAHIKISYNKEDLERIIN